MATFFFLLASSAAPCQGQHVIEKGEKEGKGKEGRRKEGEGVRSEMESLQYVLWGFIFTGTSSFNHEVVGWLFKEDCFVMVLCALSIKFPVKMLISFKTKTLVVFLLLLT